MHVCLYNDVCKVLLIAQVDLCSEIWDASLVSDVVVQLYNTIQHSTVYYCILTVLKIDSVQTKTQPIQFSFTYLRG